MLFMFLHCVCLFQRLHCQPKQSCCCSGNKFGLSGHCSTSFCQAATAADKQENTGSTEQFWIKLGMAKLLACHRFQSHCSPIPSGKRLLFTVSLGSSSCVCVCGQTSIYLVLYVWCWAAWKELSNSAVGTKGNACITCFDRKIKASKSAFKFISGKLITVHFWPGKPSL